MRINSWSWQIYYYWNNKFSGTVFDERLKQAKLATTIDLSTVNNVSLKTSKITNIYMFIGKSYFSDNGSQNFLIFQAIFNTFIILVRIANTVIEWESKGLSNGTNYPHY